MIKRSFDFIFSFSALVLLAPVFLMLALLIRLFLGSPIFFTQARPGLHGKPFKMIKFRSMTNEHGLNGQLLQDSQRLTALGRFLRATSLDELPELWNVLCGDMSIVGPRPLLLEYLSLYTPKQMRRHEVRPGITGWAQINGRNSIGWGEKFDLDVWYVDNWSLGLDLKILLMTVKTIYKKDGIYSPGGPGTNKFNGKN